MSKIRDPHRFSEWFGISEKLLRQRGAFDPILNADTLLFIDPLLLHGSEHQEMRSAHTEWQAHFKRLTKLLANITGVEDPVFRAADKQLSFLEFRGTCLGYGSGSIRGSALPRDVRHRILATARRIVELGVRDPELFTLIPLLEDDVGPDSISDMTSHVIAKRLAEFTQRVLRNVEIDREQFVIGGSDFQLPVNPFGADLGGSLPVVLVPLDVLRDLPVASTWSDIGRVSAENAALRDRINAAIGDIWARHSKREKAELRESALSSREAFDALLEALRTLPRRAYDLDADPAGRSNWLELGRQIAERFPYQLALTKPDMGGLRQVVESIIERYQYLIENQGVWKLLYGPGGKPLHEGASQKVFFVAADSYCHANNVDVTPEANSGSGPVDFKLSRGYDARVVVELKLSTNPRLRHGYQTQLDAYMRGERTDVGFFVVLHVTGGRKSKQLDDILNLEAAARSAGQAHSPITVIDARPRASASKR